MQRAPTKQEEVFFGWSVFCFVLFVFFCVRLCFFGFVVVCFVFHVFRFLCVCVCFWIVCLFLQGLFFFELNKFFGCKV